MDACVYIVTSKFCLLNPFVDIVLLIVHTMDWDWEIISLSSVCYLLEIRISIAKDLSLDLVHQINLKKSEIGW